eukprot:scaffold225712_cov32-Tisochrysis_lutea.AAC.5
MEGSATRRHFHPTCTTDNTRRRVRVAGELPRWAQAACHGARLTSSRTRCSHTISQCRARTGTLKWHPRRSSTEGWADGSRVVGTCRPSGKCCIILPPHHLGIRGAWRVSMLCAVTCADILRHTKAAAAASACPPLLAASLETRHCEPQLAPQWSASPSLPRQWYLGSLPSWTSGRPEWHLRPAEPSPKGAEY